MQNTTTAPVTIWNKVAFTGNLGRDPEMNYTPTGKAVTKFSIAVSQGKDKDKDPMWLDITCWQDLAEEVFTQAAKGTQVEVRGRLTQESWKDKEGKTRRAFKVVADTVLILHSTKADKGDKLDTPPVDDPAHPF